MYNQIKTNRSPFQMIGRAVAIIFVFRDNNGYRYFYKEYILDNYMQ